MDEELVRAHEGLSLCHWWFRGRRAVVRALLKKAWGAKSFDKILDIGAGGGSMLPLLKEFGRTITVLEPDHSLAAHLHNQFIGDGSVEVIKGDLKSVNNTQYDVVTLFDVLEHIEDDKEALGDIHSILKLGGSLVITVPAFKFLWSNHDQKNGHWRRYTEQELALKLKASGFKIQRLTYFNTILFPLALLVRIFDKYTGKRQDNFSLGATRLNSILCSIFSAESLVLPSINFPFGVSLFALAVHDDK